MQGKYSVVKNKTVFVFSGTVPSQLSLVPIRSIFINRAYPYLSFFFLKKSRACSIIYKSCHIKIHVRSYVLKFMDCHIVTWVLPLLWLNV